MKKDIAHSPYFFLVILIISALCFPKITWGAPAPPEIYSIVPDNGHSTESTNITINGANFQPTPTLALYGGGPFVGGFCNTPGSASGVYIEDTRAYVADGNLGLQVIDVSDPQNPSIVGSCDTIGWALGVYVEGNAAYVADDDSGLQIIDISDPENPSIVGSCDTTGDASGVYVKDTMAYVAVDNAGLQIINVSDPENPSIVGACDTPGAASGVYVKDTMTYVADGNSGLQIIDISNPQNPSIVGSCATPDRALSVYVKDTMAYVAADDSGLQIIDITDPQNPSIVGSCDTPDGALSVYVKHTKAYVADGNSGLQIIDISNPQNPSIVGLCDTPYGASGIYIESSKAYVADGTSGLQIIDISGPQNPSIVGSCDTSKGALGIYVESSKAYVAADSGLQIVDISDPQNPSIVGSCATSDGALGVYVEDSKAYVAADSEGLQVIDISDPQNLIIIGACDTTGDASGVYVKDSKAYVAADSEGLQIVDISDPQNPSIVGSCATPDGALGVYVEDSKAYVAADSEGLQVIDISDPQNPSIVGSCGTPGWALGVYVKGTMAYVADGNSGLQVIDINDPQNPGIVGSCDTPGWALGVYIESTTAYVADDEEGLQVIDITDPQNPTIVGTCNTPGSASGIYIEGNKVYVADDEEGLQIIEKFEPLTEITYLDEHTIRATVPPGFRGGVYNLHVTNPFGEHSVRNSAFSVYSNYYKDEDSDGYGDAENLISALYAPEGYVANDTDCDDTDPDRFPGNPEICDGKDNDCDDNIPLAEETDVDGDGAVSCSDCDDRDSSIYPGAVEIECDEIDQDCSNGDYCPGTESELIVHYPFDSDAQDHSGQENHGVIHGALFDQGQAGNALSFDGDDYVECEDSENLNVGEKYSVSLWINATSVSKVQCLFERGVSAGNRMGVWLDDDSISFETGDSWKTGSAVGANEWYHIVAVHDGSIDTEYVYLNGNLFDSRNERTVDTPNQGKLFIAKSPAYQSNNFNGKIDDVRFYNKALSETEVSKLYKGEPIDCTDRDGDGFSREGSVCGPIDCNDINKTVYPGAPELCDGKDNNCDDIVPVDETDADSDEYSICEGDCDDNDPDRFPGNPEICDEKDNDCDGSIPPPESTDADGDGVVACKDFDDTDANTYPGAVEICDCKDNNNNQQIDEDCVNNAPTIPAFLSINPSQVNNETTSQQPLITIQNSMDISNSFNQDCQTITYTLEIYSDQGLTSLVTNVSELTEGEEETSWQVDVILEDNCFYYSRARAFDGIDYSEWNDIVTFFMNTTNDQPSIPHIYEPGNEAEIIDTQPTLTVTNAIDADYDPLLYEYELYSDEKLDTPLTSNYQIIEGSGSTTSWMIDSILQDNTFYWWRVQATDNENLSSGWSNLWQFFVNTAEDPPTIPLLYSPQNGEEADTLDITVQINNSSDEDLDTLTYFFEIDKKDTFDSPSLQKSSEISQSPDGFTSWDITELDDNTMYYWRAMAYDGQVYSQWSSPGSFFVNLSNDPPSVPTINNPGDNSEVTAIRPTLSINPSTDLDFDKITYDFELYSDEALSNLVKSISDTEGSWHIDVNLVNYAHYYWRVCSVDEHGCASEWSPIAMFKVNSTGFEVILYASQDISASAQSLQTIKVMAAESPLQGVTVEIPPEALTNDVTITIGEAINTPPLPSTAKPIGKIIDFGPTGTHFAIPVSIKIPYTQEDLHNADVNDPSELEVFTYNTATLLWESVVVDNIDRENNLLICNINHFTLYSLGVTIPQDTDTDIDTNTDTDDGGSTGCFLFTIESK
ncbi:MAG: MopE-related protein [bacterium]